MEIQTWLSCHHEYIYIYVYCASSKLYCIWSTTNRPSEIVTTIHCCNIYITTVYDCHYKYIYIYIYLRNKKAV